MVVTVVLPLLLVLGHASAATVTCHNGTNVHTVLTKSSIIESEGYTQGIPYPNSYTCAVTLTAPLRSQNIRLDFEDFEVESSSHCHADTLVVFNVIRGAAVRYGSFCASQRPKPILSFGNTIRILFSSNRLRTARGFRIRATPTIDQSVCGRKEYQCADRTCIPLEKSCDGVFDCADASDERTCSTYIGGGGFSVKETECGRPVVEPADSNTDRIVGGEEAVPHSWPWQISFHRKQFEPLGHFCGGTLITSQWIVGAGHCFTGRSRAESEVVVKAGMHDLLNPGSGQQTRRPSRIIVHPLFNGGWNMNYDIALIKVSPPFNFTDTVRPACVPRQDAEVAPNTTCYSTGWGNTRGTGKAFRLKQVKLGVQEFDQCKGIVVKAMGIEGRRSVCAGSPDAVSGPCHGDSGGPLVCKADNNRWMIHGATSLGIQTAVTSSVCGMGEPALWNSVASHGDWIRQQILMN